jgi:hypothetical protein
MRLRPERFQADKFWQHRLSGLDGIIGLAAGQNNLPVTEGLEDQGQGEGQKKLN